MTNAPWSFARKTIWSCLLLAASLAFADVHVTPTGAGAADGSDWANAYPATQLQTAVNDLPAGQTVYLGSGTYTNGNLIINSSGSEGAPKRIIGVDTGGGFPLFQGVYVVDSQSGASFLRFPGAAHYWEIKNLSFRNYRYVLDMSLSGTTFDLRSNLVFENLAMDSIEDGLRIRNATQILIKNCSAIRYTKKAFRIGLYTSFMTYDGCSTDCNGGDDTFPARAIPVGFGGDDTNGDPLIHDITFVDCSSRNNRFQQSSDDYWNGDGFSTERGTYNIHHIRCASFDNHDGGYDHKATNTTFQDCIALGNKIGFRHWAGGGVYENCLSAYNKKRGGTSSSEALWISGNGGELTARFCTFHNNDSSQIVMEAAAIAVVEDSILSTDLSTAGFVSGPAQLTRTATYRPGVGVDPLYVAPSIDWRGAPADAFDNATYGLTKGYSSTRVGAPSNIPPTLAISATPNSGMPPLTVQFTAAAGDTDGIVVGYFWQFGDGSTSVDQNPSHTYTGIGSFVAQCIVRDNRGGSATQTVPIEITVPTTPTALRIESGSTTAYTDSLGQTWVADHSYGPGGGIVNRGAIEIANTVDDRLYQTERWGLSNYGILLANGTYTINLHFAETYPGITAAGQRVFSVTAEGASPAGWSNIDLFAETGGRNVALVKSATVRVTDNMLNLAFAATADNPLINAIELVPSANQGPDLAIAGAPTSGGIPLAVNFTATASDADGVVVAYQWDFGDGSSSTLQNPSHTYADTGIFAVSCTAIDNQGAMLTRHTTVTASGPAPGGLMAVRGAAGDATLTWNANGGATSYHVKRATTSGGPYTTVATVTTTTHTDVGLVSGQTYYYVVSSLGAGGESANSAEVSVTAKNITTIVDDADMSGVVFTGVWTTATTASGYYGSGYKADNNTGSTGGNSARFTPTLTGGSYQVYLRWTSGSNRASNLPVDITHAGGTTTVTVNQRNNGGTWMLLGTFQFGAGTGGNVLLRNTGTNGFVIADAVQFIELEPVPPQPPTGLTATGGVGQVSLTWTAPVGATSYNVKRAVTAGGSYTTIASGIAAANYTDTTAIGGTTYHYVVTAQNAYGESTVSASASAAAQLSSVIVDNTHTANTIIVGEWPAATTANGYYGSNYLTDLNTGSVGGKSVTFFPTLSGGTYVVSLRWTSGTNRANNVPVEVHHLGGVTLLTVNQRVNGGAWIPLGTFEFAPGTAGRVVVKNDGANGFVIADAVQFAQTAAVAANAPVITSATTAAGIYGQPFQYAITADNDPSFYSAAGLPAGLTLNTATGVISGAPTAVGAFSVGLGAINTAGTGTASLALVVAAAPQSITFPNPGPKTYGDAPVTLAATASSGLPVSYSLVSGPAQLSGATVTLTGAGPVEIEANQSGNGLIAPAAPVRISFVVAKAAQTITFPNPGPKTFGDAPFALTATASSGLPVTYLLVSGPAQIAGSTVTLSGAGTVEIEANQAGDANREAAPPVRTTFVVAKATAEITLDGLLQTYDGMPKPVTAQTDPTGLDVLITYDGSEDAPVYPGSYAVVATLEDDDYTGSVSGTLVISTSIIVRHAPVINGIVDGSVQVLLSESFALNGNAAVSGDLLVPGTPSVVLNGNALTAGTLDAGGVATPGNATITLNGGAVVRYIVRQVDPADLPAVAAPAAPTGTQDTTLNNSSQSVADFAVVRNLTLNGNAGTVAVPPGVYGNLTANGNSGFVFGVAGTTEPAVYQLQQLQLNGASKLDLVGPVVIRLANNLTLNGSINKFGEPSALVVEIANGGVTLNGSTVLLGSVIAPSGTVTVNGSSTLRGKAVRADRITINGNGLLSTDLE